MRSAVLGLAIAVSVAACGSQITPTTSPGPVAIVSTGSASPEAAVTASPEPTTATLAPTPLPPPASTPAPTPAPTPRPLPVCLASGLTAQVTGWQGAAGHQIASITLTNKGSGTCTVRGTPEVELVDTHGGILIDSQTGGPDGLPHIASGATAFHLAKGGSLKTMVDTANYCGAAPALPTTVAFVLPASAGRLVAAAGPGGGVPPCNGSKGSLGSIAMNGWQK